MRIKLFYFLFLIPFATNAQQVDSLRLSKAQQYIWFGINYSFVSRSDSAPNAVCADCSNASKVSNQRFAPGLQFGYSITINPARRFSLFFGADAIFYHTHFQFINDFTEDFLGVSSPYGSQVVQTQINYNSSSLGLRLSVGTHLNLAANTYLSFGVEPQALLANSSYPYSYTILVPGNPPTIISYLTGVESLPFSNLNCNLSLGFGATLAKKSKNPLAIELYATAAMLRTSLYSSYLRRYSIEFNIGYKL